MGAAINGRKFMSVTRSYFNPISGGYEAPILITGRGGTHFETNSSLPLESR